MLRRFVCQKCGQVVQVNLEPGDDTVCQACWTPQKVPENSESIPPGLEVPGARARRAIEDDIPPYVLVALARSLFRLGGIVGLIGGFLGLVISFFERNGSGAGAAISVLAGSVFTLAMGELFQCVRDTAQNSWVTRRLAEKHES